MNDLRLDAASFDGWDVATLAPGTTSTKGSALAALGTALGFPDHYGHNLDALADCLRDLEGHHVVVWHDWRTLATTDESVFRKIRMILREHGVPVLLAAD